MLVEKYGRRKGPEVIGTGDKSHLNSCTVRSLSYSSQIETLSSNYYYIAVLFSTSLCEVKATPDALVNAYINMWWINSVVKIMIILKNIFSRTLILRSINIM